MQTLEYCAQYAAAQGGAAEMHNLLHAACVFHGNVNFADYYFVLHAATSTGAKLGRKREGDFAYHQ